MPELNELDNNDPEKLLFKVSDLYPGEGSSLEGRGGGGFENCRRGVVRGGMGSGGVCFLPVLVVRVVLGWRAGTGGGGLSRLLGARLPLLW